MSSRSIIRVGAVAATTVLALYAGIPAGNAATRPHREHLPRSVAKATVGYHVLGQPSKNKSVKLGRTRLHRLARDFNRLKVEPRGTIHCDIAGGPMTTVVFRTAHHKWVATQAACTNVMVTRDGKSLPTLLPSTAWSKALARDLRH
jgi:hypothetical protein